MAWLGWGIGASALLTALILMQRSYGESRPCLDARGAPNCPTASRQQLPPAGPSPLCRAHNTRATSQLSPASKLLLLWLACLLQGAGNGVLGRACTHECPALPRSPRCAPVQAYMCPL